jgi:hypothetical protein
MWPVKDNKVHGLRAAYSARLEIFGVSFPTVDDGMN